MTPARLLCATLLAAACAGCGDDTGDVDGDTGAGPTDVTLTVRLSSDAPERRSELRCAPLGGTHPDPAAACALLERVEAAAFAPVPGDRACTEIYGGPQTARVTGVLRGEEVDARFSRVNGCEIERWDALVPLLPAP